MAEMLERQAYRERIRVLTGQLVAAADLVSRMGDEVRHLDEENQALYDALTDLGGASEEAPRRSRPA